MLFVLWLIAVILVVAGIVVAIRGNIVLGIVLVIVGLLIGPGGVSILDLGDRDHHGPHSMGALAHR